VVVSRRDLVTLLRNVRGFAAGEPLMNVVDNRLWF